MSQHTFDTLLLRIKIVAAHGMHKCKTEVLDMFFWYAKPVSACQTLLLLNFEFGSQHRMAIVF